MAKDVTELWGHKFEVVKNGLSEAQVVSFVNELMSEHEMLIQRQEHLSSLTKLAEKTVAEAEKLAEEIKKEAADKAKDEASKIVAEAEAQAQQSAEEERAEIMAKATKQAETIKANAERETELILDRQRKRIQPELKSMVQRVYDRLLSDLESLNKQAAAMGEEFERKLSQLAEEVGAPTEVLASVPQEDNLTRAPSSEAGVESISDTLDQLRQLMEEGEEQLRATSTSASSITDKTSEGEEEALVLGDNQAPTTYKEKVELEFPSPANILQILEIDKYLETLSEVEATEIIPIAGKPVITVYLREPMQLIDTLGALPEVSQVKEETAGESTATGDGTEDEGKLRKLQITLSGDTNTAKDKAKG